MNLESAYQTLKLDLNAPISSIKQAYRRLALLTHSDKKKKNDNSKNNESFIEVKQAYKYLVDFKRSNEQHETELEIEQAEPNEFYLPLTLEEIFTGCTKEETIKRKKLNDDTQEIEEEEAILNVEVKPGILTGSRIVIENEGDRHVGRIPANAVFIVTEVAHELFRRFRFNLQYTAQIYAEEAFLGEIAIPTLECEPVPLVVEELITLNTVKKIPGRGLPLPGGDASRRGDLHVKFEIIYDSDLPQDEPIERDLLLTLEQVLGGCRKNMTIKRMITDGNGVERFETLNLNINVQPGTETGTVFTFYKKGDKRPGAIPADIIFVTKDRPHLMFKRNGSDIEYVCKLTKSEADASGIVCEVPTLDVAEKLQITVNELIDEETTKIFPGYGLPTVDDPENRGDLVVRFKILSNLSIDAPVKHKLRLTMEIILTGVTKRMKIKRKIFDEEGNELAVDKILTINVKPGTKVGTEFTFPRQGDSYPDSIESDLIFILADKPHEHFVRIGADIEYIVRMTQNEFGLGGTVSIPTLEKDELSVSLEDIIQPSTTVRRFVGRGLPKSEDDNTRGDLIVRFDVIESKQDHPIMQDLYLTEEQLNSGCSELIKMTRTVTDIKGIEKLENQQIEIEIPPGTAEGQQFSFLQMGDSRPGHIPGDLIVTVKCKPQDPPINYDIEIPLEAILTGITKRLKINRKIIDEEGNERSAIKIVSIDIKPGTEEGTQFTFLKEGDRLPNRVPADIIFTILDKPHNTFQRKVANIEYSVEVPEDQVKDGFEISIPTLDGELITKSFAPNQVTRNPIHRIHGQGLPFPNNSDMNGDLIVRFNVGKYL